MPKENSREAILKEAKIAIQAFLKTDWYQNFSQTKASKRFKPEDYLLRLAGQMYDLYGSSPHKWRRAQLRDVLMWQTPDWVIMSAETRSLDWVEILIHFIEFAAEQGEIARYRDIDNFLHDSLHDPSDGMVDLQRKYLSVKLRQILHVPYFTEEKEIATFEHNHITDAILMAYSLPYNNFRQVIDQFRHQDSDTRAVFTLLNTTLNKNFKDAITLDDIRFQAVLFEIVHDEKREVGMNERLLIALENDKSDLNNGRSIAAFLKNHAAVIAELGDASQIEATLKAFANGEAQPEILETVTKLDANETAHPNDPERLIHLYRPGGTRDSSDFRYLYIDLTKHQAAYLGTDLMRKLYHSFNSATKPDEALTIINNIFKSHPEVKAATDYADAAAILNPFLVRELPLVNDFLNEFNQQNYFQNEDFTMSVEEVDGMVNAFFNDMLIETGRFPNRWTGGSAKHVLENPDGIYADLNFQQAQEAYEIYISLIDFIEQRHMNSYTEPIRKAFDDYIGVYLDENAVEMKAKPANVQYGTDMDTEATDEDTMLQSPIYGLFARLLVMGYPEADDEDPGKVVQAHQTEAMMFAEDMSLEDLINLASAGNTNITDEDTFTRFGFDWYMRYVAPLYTREEAAHEAGVPLVANDDEFWTNVFNHREPDDEPIPQALRLKIAMEHWMRIPGKPTEDQARSFARKYAKELEVLNITADEFEKLVVDDQTLGATKNNKIISLDEARRKKNRKN